ncbi:glycerophosphodiester phosphodiesterase [Winogradskyella litoriviva]|uniref:Glycerophosphodiester phosphodiesterase n=1 Tax=Winogradskyella litoriviva TaxID=1220182 RepID=A0ABX2EA02_9FLAO|nr:glycerophosphodiester phosphodiesterase [Winogradskyella litoriviva]NRD24559.1 glycerophosphodiester phosphodiesterase [Winogradskyella litoriviva]
MSCNTEIIQIDIQGHRGCRGLMPENSLPAFEKAIELGVTTLELDIAISKDNKVVVTHEPYMNPLICLDATGEVIPDALETHYNLYKMDYNEIKQFDCGSKFHPRFPNQQKIKTFKPLLSEVFDLVKRKNSDVKFNIEIKSEQDYYNIFTPKPEAYVALVLDELKRNDMLSRVILQSFDIKILREIRKQSPKTEIALLVDENEEIWDKISKLDIVKLPEIISPYYKLLDEKKVRNLQAENFKVIPWTINEEKDMEQMMKWKVDGIITDYPNRLIDLL